VSNENRGHHRQETISVFENDPFEMAQPGKFRVVTLGNEIYPSFSFGSRDLDTLSEARKLKRIAIRTLVPGAKDVRIYDDTAEVEE
jgi:hypothetical protein